MKINSMKPPEKARCKFGWECLRRSSCKFDDSFLYKKVNVGLRRKVHCNICNNTFSKTKHMEAHKLKQHYHKEIECESCGQYFVSHQEYSEHVETDYANSQKDVDLWALEIISQLEKHTKNNQTQS